MEPGLAPSWVESALPILLWVAVGLGVLWLIFKLLDYWNRRAYNLTVADRTGNGGKKPGFLEVDQEKREKAIEAGEALDEKLLRRAAAPAPGAGRAARYVGFGASFFAVLTLLTAVVGAFARIEYYDRAVRQMTSFERLGEIIATYWIGFVVVAALIIVQIYQFVVTVKRP